MSRRFAVTFDYRGVFARNLAEYVVRGLESGPDWSVEYWPFSVEQTKRGDDTPTIWDDPGDSVSFLAMQVGLAVRDRFPDRFPAVHLALFAARHDHQRDLREKDVLHDVLAGQGIDPDAVFDDVAGGGPLETYRREHRRALDEYQAFGVPVVVCDGQSAFVRLMDRPTGDAEAAGATIERLLDLVADWPGLDELKHTATPGRH